MASPAVTFGALSYDDLWDTPYFCGPESSGTSLVPKLFPVAIAGHPYAIDYAKYRRTTMQIRRLQTDDSVEPGENSLNATGLWPRAQDNWFLGAGQMYLDNRFAYESVYVHSGEYPSVRTRFWRSKGIDPWTESQLKLLPEQGLKRTSSNTNLLLVATATALYVSDGDEVYFSTNPSAATPTWTASGIAAKLGSAITGLCTDGHTVYACDSTHGIAYTVDQATSATHMVDSTYAATNVWYAKGFLLATTGRDLVEVNATGAFQGAYNSGTTYSIGQGVSSGGIAYTSLVSSNVGNTPSSSPSDWGLIIDPIWTHPSLAFVWTAVTETPSAILVAGNSGAQAFIGSLQADAATNGASLAVPYSATSLSPGETINGLSYCGGSVVLATSEGIRSGTSPDTAGIFDTNPVITDAPNPQCLASWREFCYFGWTNYSTADGQVYNTGVTSSGLGRADLSQYTNPGVPAYATDIMAADGTSAVTQSVAILAGVPYFTLKAGGVYGPTGNVVPEGTILPGWIRYGTLENKIVCTSQPYHDPLLAGQSIDTQLANESSEIVFLGSSNLAGSTGPPSSFNGQLIVGIKFQPIITLKRGTDTTQGPTLLSWIDKAMVVPPRQDEIICPILLRTREETIKRDGHPYHFDTLAEFKFLKGLENLGEAVLYQEGSESILCYIDQVQIAPESMNFVIGRDADWFNCICTVKLITLENQLG